MPVPLMPLTVSEQPATEEIQIQRIGEQQGTSERYIYFKAIFQSFGTAARTFPISTARAPCCHAELLIVTDVH